MRLRPDLYSRSSFLWSRAAWGSASNDNIFIVSRFCYSGLILVEGATLICSNMRLDYDLHFEDITYITLHPSDGPRLFRSQCAVSTQDFYFLINAFVFMPFNSTSSHISWSCVRTASISSYNTVLRLTWESILFFPWLKNGAELTFQFVWNGFDR